MIIVHLKDGLGNQLYQYAVGRHLSYKNNTVLKLDISDCQDSSKFLGYYRLGAFNIQENFATPKEIENMKLIKPKCQHDTFIPEILDLPDNVYLYGQWVNAKYFNDIREILLKELTLKNPLSKAAKIWKEKITSSDCAVSIHRRLGDYMSTLWRNNSSKSFISTDFYYKCISEIKKFSPKFTVFVFSDNLELAKRTLKFDVPTEYIEGCETDAEELYLMSLCKHNIIPKSTFSWWGAWLNQNPDKKIFSVAGGYDVQKDWIEIPSNSISNPNCELAPFLSIIIYVQDNISSVRNTMQSVLSQQFKDYEVIIVDSSADVSGKICREFAQNSNVTILRTDYSTNKFSAWNMALNLSRGDYVLFLTGKDFMFYHATEMFFLYVNDEHYKNSFVKGRELSNWIDFAKDIICALQTVEETEELVDKIDLPEGEKFTFNNVLNVGIDGKKFSLKVDEHFNGAEKFQKLIADGAEKLNLLANEKLNTLLCTKIFKRKFLQEKNIRFKENLDRDAELLFLAETFLQTDEIALINRTFCGTFK